MFILLLCVYDAGAASLLRYTPIIYYVTVSFIQLQILYYELVVFDFILVMWNLQGLTEKFKEKDTGYSGSATFTYESFMLTVLPFLIA